MIERQAKPEAPFAIAPHGVDPQTVLKRTLHTGAQVRAVGLETFGSDRFSGEGTLCQPASGYGSTEEGDFDRTASDAVVQVPGGKTPSAIVIASRTRVHRAKLDLANPE